MMEIIARRRCDCFERLEDAMASTISTAYSSNKEAIEGDALRRF